MSPLEEGTWAAWLYDLLKPHVTEFVVCNPRKNALLKKGNKSDRIDARKLAELLRNRLLSAVYHGENGLRLLKELSRSYLTISKDLGRVMNRLKALYRSWAIPCAGRKSTHRAPPNGWRKLPKPACAGVQNFATSNSTPCAHYTNKPGKSFWPRAASTAQRNCYARFRYRSAAGGSIGCVAADTPSIPHQAETVDLQRAGVGDPRQRAIPLC